MFYYSKWLFFIMFYAISAALYWLVDKHLLFKDLPGEFFWGAGIVFCVIVLASYITAVLISVPVKYLYMAACRVFGIEEKSIARKMFWIVFTFSTYLIAFIIFLKAIQY